MARYLTKNLTLSYQSSEMRIFTTKRIAKMVPPAIWVRAGEPIIQLFFESSAKREFGEWNRHSAKRIECARYDPLFTILIRPSCPYANGVARSTSSIAGR